MVFKCTEKEFISALIKYEGKVKSLAELLNKSKLLEKELVSCNMEGRILFF